MNEGKEELDELREAVREFLAAKSPESAVRAAIQDGGPGMTRRCGTRWPASSGCRAWRCPASTAATGSA